MGIELEILIVLSCGCSGLLCGWLLRIPDGLDTEATTAESNERSEEQLKDAAENLRLMSLRVAADVDKHQTKIQQVSNVLADTPEGMHQDELLKEVEKLVQANEKMQQQLGDAQSQIREQAQAIQSAEELALTDALTGIANRRAFDLHLDGRAELNVAENPTTLMILDIDHFKKFNDTYGHQIGDEVLKLVANHLDAGFIDIAKVARYGGEEFAVIFDEMTIGQVKDLADEVRGGIGHRDFIVEDQRIRITGSAGIAERLPGESLNDWVERADKALYTAKECGRNRAYWMDEHEALPVHEELQSGGTSQDTSAEITTLGLELPTLEDLAENSASTLSKLQAEGIPVCLLTLHVMHENVDAQQLKLVYSSMQSSMRGIDSERIGFDQEGTFVVCLPSADESIAEARGTDALSSIVDAIDAETLLKIRLGVTSALPNESFDVLLQRALKDLDSCEVHDVVGEASTPSHS